MAQSGIQTAWMILKQANDDDSDKIPRSFLIKNDEANLLCLIYETQVSEGGEADLHKYFVDCKKNPGHTKFVPITEFNIHHLPDGHHDNDIFEYIKAIADLTVRVDVKKTSMHRPEFWPNTNVIYAFYNMRGSDVMRVGTGMVNGVEKYREEESKGTCQCHKCQHSDTPSKLRGEVRVYTATHVVFDDIEARHTTCRFFYDRQDSPLVTLGGWTVVVANIDEDRCVLKCVTCDADLLDRLVTIYRDWWALRSKIYKKYARTGDVYQLTIVVSHPHGCPKQVSLGKWINRYVVGKDRTLYTYIACTCPGSSGAKVNLMQQDDWYYVHHVHSGVNSAGSNMSCTGLELTSY